MQTLTITQPDDWHVHFRDDPLLIDTVAATARHFQRALVMPNLLPALTSVESVLQYKARILAAAPPNQSFEPLMTLYLNEAVTPDDLLRCKKNAILGAKFYPAGATTHSAEGSIHIRALYPLLDIMQQEDLVLQLHGEITRGDVFDREKKFITEYLVKLVADFPRLRIVLEHISSKAAVEFIEASSSGIAATITPHHLLYHRNDMLAGNIRPHYYCLPILKRASDQKALIKAAISGNPRFFAGTDSAPHAQHRKETACGCAGIYSAPYAVALYADVFEQAGALLQLDAFLGRWGAEFYQKPLNQRFLQLRKKPQSIPAFLPLGNDQVIPIAAGEKLAWSIDEHV